LINQPKKEQFFFSGGIKSEQIISEIQMRQNGLPLVELELNAQFMLPINKQTKNLLKGNNKS